MEDENKLKLVIFGAFGAGKTTLVKTLDPESKHIEAECAGGTTTIALDYGRLLVHGHTVYLFGTPGQERFEFAREIIAKGMDGAILLVDATSPMDGFTHHLYDSLTAASVPFVVFLNKCGSAGAVPDTLKKSFSTARVVQVSATDFKQSRDAISDFVGTLPPHHNVHTIH
jgi:hypothetical protein